MDKIAAQPAVDKRAECAAKKHGKRKLPWLQPGTAGCDGDKAVRDKRQEAERHDHIGRMLGLCDDIELVRAVVRQEFIEILSQPLIERKADAVREGG